MDESLKDVLGRDVAAAGVEAAERPAVVAYLLQRFDVDRAQLPRLPLSDAPGIQDWCLYAEHVRQQGSLRAVYPYLQELRAMQAAASDGDVLDSPEKGALTIEATATGKLPVISCGSRLDFIRVVCALARRKEADIPDSMGALLVNNYWNATRWDRYLDEVIRGTRAGAETGVRRADYQDCFAIVGPGPYSGVPAELVGLKNDDWLKTSLALRKTHECVHYLTKRLFGNMHIHLHDELLADYGAMVSVTGSFNSSWSRLFFVGGGPQSCSHGRVRNYMPKDFSAASRACVTRVLLTAIDSLADFTGRFGQPWSPSPREYTACLCSIAGLSLAELAQAGAVAKLHSLYDHQVSRSGEWQL